MEDTALRLLLSLPVCQRPAIIRAHELNLTYFHTFSPEMQDIVSVKQSHNAHRATPSLAFPSSQTLL
jgi:hypothetical protein